jgi:hypothetical protein
MAQRTRLVKEDAARIKFALGNDELGMLVYNILAGLSGGQAEQSFLSAAPNMLTGAVAGSGVVAREFISGPNRLTRLTLTGRTVTMTDEAGVVAYGGTKLYDFPTGAIRITGVGVSLTVTKSGAGINDDFDGDWGIGTATAGNNNALATTEQDIVATTATTQAVAGVTSIAFPASSATVVSFDGTGTAKDLFLNFLIDDVDQDGGGTLSVTGTIDITWQYLGDV